MDSEEDHGPAPWAIEALRDLVAVQDEHSHVGAEQRRRIGELVLSAENPRESLEETALRLALELQAGDLAAIVADWLEVQIAI